MTYPFAAMMSRMKYINRWGLMRNTRHESLSEHVTECAVTAHILAALAADEFKADDVRPDKVALAALYHDADEILTGDLPTPVKYRNRGILGEYKRVEKEMAETILTGIPESISERMREAVEADDLTEHEKKIIKAADRLSALFKCIEEERSGNLEFKSAKQSTLDKLEQDMLPETKYFIDHFLPCYEMDLDELISQNNN